MNKGLSIKRWAVTFVEYGDSVDGKARLLGIYGTPVEAYNAMKKAAKQYKKDLCLDFLEVYRESASVGHTDECGCEYRMEEVDIPLLPTDHDVWVH